MAMITEIEDYFTDGCGRCDRFATPDCVVRLWSESLARLRAICLAAGLTETVKWGHPCYMHGTRNIVLIGALRGDVRLNFFKSALLKDPHKILQKQGPNTRHADSIRITSAQQLDELAPAIAEYLAEAISYAEQGILPEREEYELELPLELLDALDADAELAEAFRALTPGRQRSYVIGLSSAKTSETRVARIGKYRERIIGGKGANER